MSQKYGVGFKARAVMLIEDRIRIERCSAWMACVAVGQALGGVSPHTLRNWWKQRRVDDGRDLGVSTSELEELRRLRRENLELRRADEILKAASAFSQRSSTAPRRDDPFRRRAPRPFRG